MRGWIIGGVAMSMGCIDGTTGTNTGTPEPFACGTGTCDADQYCEEFVPGVKPETGSVSSSFECKDAPSTCNGTPTCACLASEKACSTDCDESGDGVRCALFAP